MRARVLVVDDDEDILRLVAHVLRTRGYEVAAARDGASALEQAEARMPDVVVTDVEMPRMGGWTLIRRLRSLPGSSFVPVIFLTARSAPEDRAFAFRLGADDFLEKPFKYEDIPARIERALAARRRIEAGVHAPPGAAAAPGIRGSLAELGISSLLTLFEMERKSGRLALERPTGERAEIYLREGRVVQALVIGGADPRGAEAIYHVLAWSSGTFAFGRAEVDIQNAMDVPTHTLLMEGARRLDERRS